MRVNFVASVSVRSLHRRTGAFTIVEMLIVLSIILVLAGLILGTAGYVQGKGARARAEGEIAAFSSALESYKTDNGTYPRDTTNKTTDNLDPRTSGTPSTYQTASQFLYIQLSGNSSGNPTVPNSVADTRNYLGTSLKPSMLSPSPPGANTFFLDPFGYSYGYSTAYQADLDKTPPVTPPTHGYNPTYDLWSTSGNTTKPTPGTPASDVTLKWVRNW